MTRPHPMMFPPVMLDEDSRPTWSVQVELPPDIEAEIRRYVAEDALTSWTVMIHEALYIYRTVFWTREQLNAELWEAIEEGIRSGERDGYIEVTPEFWREFKHRGRKRMTELRKLTAAGTIGNLLLPQELHEFVRERMALGDCKTPTDVVCAAVPYLRKEREESQKSNGNG